MAFGQAPLGQQFGFQSPLGDQPFGTQGMGDGRQFGGIGEQFGGGLFGGQGMGQQFGGFGGLLGLTSPGGLQQGFLGRGIGRGFGSLFGNDQGQVNFGGGNFFQPGQGFQTQLQGPVQPGAGIPTTSGFNFGSLFGGA